MLCTTGFRCTAKRSGVRWGRTFRGRWRRTLQTMPWIPGTPTRRVSQPMYAEMRGRPVLPEPLQQAACTLTPRERANPRRACKGPSLLYRDKFGARAISPPTSTARKMTASSRGLRIPEPLFPCELTATERSDPQNACRGPSLLYREAHGNKMRPGFETRRGFEVKLVLALPPKPMSPSKASIDPR